MFQVLAFLVSMTLHRLKKKNIWSSATVWFWYLFIGFGMFGLQKKRETSWRLNCNGDVLCVSVQMWNPTCFFFKKMSFSLQCITNPTRKFKEALRPLSFRYFTVGTKNKHQMQNKHQMHIRGANKNYLQIHRPLGKGKRRILHPLSLKEGGKLCAKSVESSVIFLFSYLVGVKT